LLYQHYPLGVYLLLLDHFDSYTHCLPHSIHYSYYCRNPRQHHCAVEYLQLLYQLGLSLHHFSKLRTPAYSFQLPLNCAKQNANKSLKCNILELSKAKRRHVVPPNDHMMD
jgi:hypothetical protein